MNQEEAVSVSRNLRVLHDFDNPYPSGRWALRRGFSLIAYAVSKKIPFLRRYCRSIYDECYEHLWTLHQIDSLLGIRSVFGINDDVVRVFPHLQACLLRERGINAVRHWHCTPDEVHWEPQLDVPKTNWWFDLEYAEGKRKPREDEWIVFHCDYPYLLPYYVHCLHDLMLARAASSKE